ncbi:class I SAM-dependent methyltransferase [Fastidiosibacter lacustris]|uniref:class I SAM-dependent methyltransferase n=1 Tax=Fastidiosibacter lacustris TaxID=2056695 RepID=UPI000E34C2AA|nr:methyltransferase domain-containing protein [Fastidiosibacter lacustris]
MATIHTPKQYAEIYKILQKHDNSKQIITHIQNTILPYIEKQYFLDIGAGEGKITQHFISQFQNNTAIEPNSNYTKILQNFPQLTVINDIFQNTFLSHKYNFILCSHVMYHVAEQEWERFVLKAYDQLEEKGRLMFVVPSDQGVHYDKCISYNPYYKCYKLLKNIAHKYEIPYQVTIDKAFYNTETLEEMYQICRFSIVEDSFNYDMYQQLLNNGIAEFDRDVLNYAKSTKINDTLYSLVIHPAFVTLYKS